MKKIILVFMVLMLCSCSFDTGYSDNYLYSTVYPIEYASKSLYSEYATIESVYPNGADSEYVITDKKKNKYSNSEVFVYSGLLNESYLARDLLNLNENINIIDATKGMNLNNDVSELWLDPSNYLMLCSNIKNSLIDYNNSYTVTNTIENNYTKLNEKISELDVSLYNLGKNGNYDTILTTSNVFTFLTKYNINVISIDENNESLDKAKTEAKKLISNNKIQYIYTLENQTLSEEQEKFISNNSLVKIEINDLYTLTDEEEQNDDDYITLMKSIIEEYKRELYKS